MPLAGTACSLPRAVMVPGVAWGSVLPPLLPGQSCCTGPSRQSACREALGVPGVWPPLPVSVWPCLWHFCVPPLVPVTLRTTPEPIPAQSRAVLDWQPINPE